MWNNEWKLTIFLTPHERPSPPAAKGFEGGDRGDLFAGGADEFVGEVIACVWFGDGLCDGKVVELVLLAEPEGRIVVGLVIEGEGDLDGGNAVGLFLHIPKTSIS
jgi:hypothetical protein